MYCITYGMVSIMSCSALFDYVLPYVNLFGSGILRYGFYITLYHIILCHIILYLCSVLRITYILRTWGDFTVPETDQFRYYIQYNTKLRLKRYFGNVRSIMEAYIYIYIYIYIYNNANFCPPEGLAHFEKQCHLLLHSSPCSVYVHFLTMSNFNVRVSRDSHDENPE